MTRTNVELKAHDADPEATLARCFALGAEDRGVLAQRDTYFGARGGRLKLRVGGVDDGGVGRVGRVGDDGVGDGGDDDAELIAYRRPDDVRATPSSYVRAPVSAPTELAEALDAALGTVVVVTKRRRLLLWRGVRIHLDDVEGLGAFLELEAVLPDAGDEDAARETLATLRDALAIDDRSLVAAGYADLLQDGPRALLAAAAAAMDNAYAPYSRFPVGAALRGAGGAIHAAANVENAAYPQGQCAEASAIGAMVAAGETAITAVAIVAEHADHCPPCGGCRQRLSEFAAPETPVYLGGSGATPPIVTSVGELLPGAFGRTELQSGR